MRRKSYSVILLDEIEKAHPDVFNILLQILDDGRLTDAKGRRVDFRNTIVIMTSNVGAELIRRQGNLGFSTAKDEAKSAEDAYQKMKDKVLGEMKNLFKPEFLNRIDASVVFRSLTKDDIRQIIDLLLQRVRAELTEQQMKIDVTDSAKDLLMEKGYDPTYGARPMRRAIQNLIEDPLAEALLEGRFKTGDSVLIDRQGDDLVMTPKTEEAPLAEPAQA